MMTRDHPYPDPYSRRRRERESLVAAGRVLFKEKEIMSVYPFLVFIHVLGAVGTFAALTIEIVSLGRLRRAETPSDAHIWTGLLAMAFRLGPLAMVTTLVSGLGMMAMGWGRQPWLVSAMIGLVGMAVLGGFLSIRPVRQLRAALTFESMSELSNAFRSVRSGKALIASLRLRIAIGVAILGLMTFKPDAAGSSLILATGIVAGLVASFVPFAKRRSQPVEATEA
jgi:hypothetical protein